MTDALIIGGTQFIGRHTVVELLDHGYDVTIFNRGNHDNPFADTDAVDHVAGNRKDRADLERAAATDPDIVIDCVAYYPDEVRTATDVFADVDAYVFVSSGAAYGEHTIPQREDETGLHDCTPEQATDDSMETYGPRKAEGDRAVFAAAETGVNAMSVRPVLVYGPYDYTERFNYWIDRVNRFDQVLVPGDGSRLLHHVYVEDVAAALRTVAEDGEPGEAYNAADRFTFSLEGSLELVADALGTDVEVIHASEYDLAMGDLTPDDFVLYRSTPQVTATEKLHALGWDSTPLTTAVERTVEDYLASDRDGSEYDPGRVAEERIIEELTS
ncbi:MAG: NAD-dependent epimerase/dehydratase family protein [Halobacteriales archaeon]